MCHQSASPPAPFWWLQSASWLLTYENVVNRTYTWICVKVRNALWACVFGSACIFNIRRFLFLCCVSRLHLSPPKKKIPNKAWETPLDVLSEVRERDLIMFFCPSIALLRGVESDESAPPLARKTQLDKEKKETQMVSHTRTPTHTRAGVMKLNVLPV